MDAPKERLLPIPIQCFLLALRCCPPYSSTFSAFTLTLRAKPGPLWSPWLSFLLLPFDRRCPLSGAYESHLVHMLQVRTALPLFSKPPGSTGARWVHLLCLKLFPVESSGAPFCFHVSRFQCSSASAVWCAFPGLTYHIYGH